MTEPNKIENKNTSDVSKEPLPKLQNANEKSRFSRRKFLKVSAMASPIIMTTKSPTAWASGAFNTGMCSVSVLLSTNPSAPQACTAEIKSPGYWHTVLSASESSPHYPVRQALFQGSANITVDSLFNNYFLSGFEVIYREWTANISISSNNPSFIYILPDNGNANSNNVNLLISFEKAGMQADDLDIARAANFHMIMLGAYLNSQFNPNIINYGFYPQDIINAIKFFIEGCIERYIDAIENGETINNSKLNQIVKTPWETFKGTYELW